MKNERLVLVTDDSEYLILPLIRLLQKAGFDVISATDGEECLRLAFEKHPALIILDLILPKIHGMEILKRLKSNTQTTDIGIIISSGRGLFTDYQTAMEYGANYFLVKPLDFHVVVKLVKTYFAGSLYPNTFPLSAQQNLLEKADYYNPESHAPSSYIRLWGTRGSITTSGVEYYQYGGNTACLEIKYGSELVIIDAGTGIRQLGKELMKEPRRHLHLLIGHTHWDHIIGFPFFEPTYSSHFKIDVYGAKGFGKDLKDVFMSMLERDYFPVRLDEMKAALDFHELHDDKPLILGDLKIAVAYAVHPGATLCFKIMTPQKTIGYITDNEFLIGYHGHPNKIDANDPRLTGYKNMIQFFKDCDLLIHEAQYTPQEYRSKVGWGHSSLANAVLLIKFCNIKKWLITHHDPDDTDQLLKQKLQLARDILCECKIECDVDLAYDGIVLPL